jgi:hypothetical protein
MDELKKVLGEIVNAPPEKIARVKVKTKRKSIAVKAKVERAKAKTAKPKAQAGRTDRTGL